MSDDIGDTFSAKSERVFRPDDMGDTSCSMRSGAPDGAVERKNTPDTFVL